MKRLAVSLAALFLTLAATLVGSAGTASAIVPVSTPSCKNNPSFPGDSGVIRLGETAQGTFVWTGAMTPVSREPGFYKISVYGGKRVLDGKNAHYPYFPHGSLPAKLAFPGRRMSISVTLTSDSGSVYHSVQNGCVM